MNAPTAQSPLFDTLLDERLTLTQLQRRVTALLTHPSTRDVWITAELSDLHPSGGHCYLELLEKDSRGSTVARARATIWRSVYPAIAAKFQRATGQSLAAGMKVLTRVTVNHHELYGLSLNISDIDPSYTLGDRERVRCEILQRLAAEKILEQNRSLEWPTHTWRVAIISGQTAAGFGDFAKQLLLNARHLRFETRLFPATVQGDRVPSSIIDALGCIANDDHEWDVVVIIRGGGSTSDLAAFDNYDLAAAVAMFPLPVIVGIGHERDTTVLDFVANQSVKTPTAAAALLVSRAEANLELVNKLGTDIARAATDQIAGSRQRLAQLEGVLPLLPQRIAERARTRLTQMTAALGSAGSRIIAEKTRLQSTSAALATATANLLQRQRQRLDADERLIQAFSPQETLRRGFSVTRVNGHALTSADSLLPGMEIETILAQGTVRSIVTESQQNQNL